MKTDQVTFGHVVGFVLAILFALVIGALYVGAPGGRVHE